MLLSREVKGNKVDRQSYFITIAHTDETVEPIETFLETKPHLKVIGFEPATLVVRAWWFKQSTRSIALSSPPAASLWLSEKQNKAPEILNRVKHLQHRKESRNRFCAFSGLFQAETRLLNNGITPLPCIKAAPEFTVWNCLIDIPLRSYSLTQLRSDSFKEFLIGLNPPYIQLGGAESPNHSLN